MVIDINAELLSIISLVLSIIAIIISLLRAVIALKSFKLSRNESEQKRAKFKLYLEDSFVLELEDAESLLYVFSISVYNESVSKNSLTPSLLISYRGANGVSIYKMKLSHEPKLIDENLELKNEVLPKVLDVSGKGIVSGWLVFGLNRKSEIIPYKKDEYEIELINPNGVRTSESIYIMKTIDKYESK